MMGYYGGNWGVMGGAGVFGTLLGVLVLTFLVLGILYFWRELNRKR